MQPDQPEYADETERMQCEADAQAEAAYERGLAEGRRQAIEGWDREWAVLMEWVQGPEVDLHTKCAARENVELAIANMAPHHRGIAKPVSRLVGPWEPAVQQPEHAFDESSVVNPATGEPCRGSSGPEPYEPPDPLCVCGASWLGDEGCLTQQPGWTPPPPYDGPSIEELLPGKEPGCPTCSGPVRETVGMICQTCGTDYASGGVVEPSPLTAEEATPDCVVEIIRVRRDDACGPEHTYREFCVYEGQGGPGAY